MQALGFDNYAGVMKVYLSKFRVVSILYGHMTKLSIKRHWRGKVRTKQQTEKRKT
jgi:hypothetical protein